METEILYHTAPKSRLNSILRFGLLPLFARGPIKRAWLHSRTRTRWACNHVKSRHQCGAVVTLELAVPRAQVRRHQRGLFFTETPIPPDAILSVNGLKLVG